MKLLRCTLALVSSAMLAACFSYVPAEFATLPPGENIRVYLTRRAIAELGELPAENGPFLKGTLVRRENDRVFMRVPVASRQVGFFTERIGQEVAIPTGEIVQLERRKLNRTSTGLFVAGTAAAAVGVIFLILEATGNEEVVEPPPDEIRVPIFSIRLR